MDDMNSYEITPRALGGWRLRLLEDGVEVGGGAFPPEGEGADALQAAFDDAESEAYAWLDSKTTEEEEEESERPTITVKERRAREKAVAFAIASSGLEGLKPSPSQVARMQRFIDGEMDLAEFVAGIGGRRDG